MPLEPVEYELPSQVGKFGSCVRCDVLTAMADAAWDAEGGPDRSALSDVVVLREQHMAECSGRPAVSPPNSCARYPRSG